jgi:glutaredoxin
MNTVVLFSLAGCSHCDDLKSNLNRINIPFIEYEINKNPEIWSQVVFQVGLQQVPTVFIKNDQNDDGPVFVAGRDFNSREEILEIIKSYTQGG